MHTHTHTHKVALFNQNKQMKPHFFFSPHGNVTVLFKVAVFKNVIWKKKSKNQLLTERAVFTLRSFDENLDQTNSETITFIIAFLKRSTLEYDLLLDEKHFSFFCFINGECKNIFL